MKRNLTLPFAALLLGACAGAPAPQTFDEWIEGLPEPSGFTPYHAEMSMAMRFDMDELVRSMEGVEFDHEVDGQAEELVMEVAMTGWMDFGAVERARAEFEMLVDFAGLTDPGEPSSMEFAMAVVADGERLWIEPDWRSNWLMDAMESGGGGFAEMVFRADLDAVARLMEAYGEVMNQLAPGMFGEGEYMQMMRESLDLAAWPRMMERWFAVVESFEVVGDEVYVELSLSEEYAEMMENMGAMPGFGAEEFAGLRYFLTADLATGVPRTFRFEMGGAMAMEVAMTFEPRAAGEWPEGHFTYVLPDGRSAFPIDPYLDLVASMATQMYPVGQDDLEF